MSVERTPQRRQNRIWAQGLAERRETMLCPCCGSVEPAGHRRDGEPVCECGRVEGGWGQG